MFQPALWLSETVTWENALDTGKCGGDQREGVGGGRGRRADQRRREEIDWGCRAQHDVLVPYVEVYP